MTGLNSLGTDSSRYRPVALIGRGGMAEVLLALTNVGAGVERPVVLKRIWPDLAEDPDFVAMFRDEAGLAIRLDHPNVVRTYELIEDREQLAIAMEYLQGQPLAAVLKRVGLSGDLSLPLRLRVLVEVLAGLSYAHDLTDAQGTLLGVVHRDVSPENVFVTYDGQVKLMDFGVAQTEVAGYKTRPGTLKGKLSYLAPECIRGGGIDRRTDVFAVGIMLWELLAGRRMWRGMGEAHIVHHLAAGMPMPRLPAGRARPPRLDEICTRALAVDPADRYATAAELETELRGVLARAGDAPTRQLGGVVSRAFAEARIEREALITRARATAAAQAPGASPAPARDWVDDLDQLLPTIDGFFEETVVDEWIPPKVPAAVPRRRGRVRITIASAVCVVVALGLVVARAQRDGQPSFPALMEQPRSYSGSYASSRANDHANGPGSSHVHEVADLSVVPTDDPPTPTAAVAPTGAAIPDLRAHPVASPTLTSPRAANTDHRLGRRWGSGRRNRQQAQNVLSAGLNAGFNGRLPDRMDDARTMAPTLDDRGVDRARPASARSIDESDPFR